jgi:hypothetical protein
MGQLPGEVQSLLDWWGPRVEAALGPRIVGMAIGGGLALGEFAPRWSDVDVCVWLDDPLSAEEAARVESIREEMGDLFLRRRSGGWRSGQVVEPRFLTAAGARLPAQEGQGPFERLVLAHHGFRLSGETVPVAPPGRELLLAQLRADLGRLGEPRLDRPIWLTDMILWMARSLVFWRDGDLLGKSAATRREIAAGSPFAAAFRFAFRLRSQGSAACADHLPEARRHFLSVSAPVSAVLAATPR